MVTGNEIHFVSVFDRRLNYYSNLYYNLDKPEISDYEYDKLKRKILEIEEKYPEFVDKNGVRNRVGGRKGL